MKEGMELLAAEAAAMGINVDEATFEGFFREHFGRLYGLLYRVTGSAEDAEDLAQELFLQVSRRRPPIWESPSAGGWLWKAATHSALNALRGRRRRQIRETHATLHEGPPRTWESEQDPARVVERREQQEAVRKVLRELKPQESAILLLRHSGLSYAETAEVVGVKTSSIGTLLARAERRFKEKYDARFQ